MDKNIKEFKCNNKNLLKQNYDLIGLKQNQSNFKRISKENAKNNKINDVNYYNHILMNKEFENKEMTINNNINKERNKIRKNTIYENEEIKENNNKLIELENNKQFLLEKNKEIEEQIKKLQNLAKEVNYIHEKNNYYNNCNSQEEIPKKYYPSFNNLDRNYNYSMDNQNNSIKHSNYSNYSNITQDKNNYIQIEDDSLELLLDKNKKELNNIFLYEDNNNYYNIISDKNNNNGNKKILFSSRNINKNNRVSNYLNYIRKNKTFNRRKKSQESLRMNIKYNKTNDRNIIKYENKSSIIENKKDEFKLENKINNKNQNELNEKFEIIKNIINEFNNKNINKSNKKFVINKINDLQNDINYKISLLEKKYIEDIRKKIKKINKLELENANLKKKVTKIKSIV